MIAAACVRGVPALPFAPTYPEDSRSDPGRRSLRMDQSGPVQGGVRCGPGDKRGEPEGDAPGAGGTGSRAAAQARQDYSTRVAVCYDAKAVGDLLKKECK